MSPFGTERASVQAPLLRYAEEAGWEPLGREEVRDLRGGDGGIVLGDVLLAKLRELNPGVIDHQRAGETVNRLLRVSPSIEGNLASWEYLKGLRTVFVEEERRERNVRLLDFENPENNAFHVTEEMTFLSGTERIRADVVFFINGIPLIIVEAKAANRRGGIPEALEQVRRYHRQGPELLAITQLFNLTNLSKFHYGATWGLSRKALFDWRDEQAGDFETLVKTFVQPRRVLRVLSDFILFTRKDEELQKVVLRPHQMRAVDKVHVRARDAERRHGLVWHTQGSGKTLTMITAAMKLIEDPALENPTVLMIVDRNELEAQLFGNLEALGYGHVAVARSKRNLLDLLRGDQRGLIVSMIHKFDDLPERITEQSNVFVLVDEAHRTTGGNLGNYLMGALPNATYLGFTGTPIDRSNHGKGTFKVFGTDDPETGYLDKYSIRESIEEGTTVPLHYSLASNELLVDRETLEAEFLDLSEAEGASDQEEIDQVLGRAVRLKNLLKNPDRVDKVASHVAEHFTTTVEPTGYKAFLVAPDREACTMYKKVLDEHLAPEYSRVVISAGHNDPPELAAYHLGEDEERRIRKSFTKPDEQPKILIVTEKLLTGYDAPILYCMYLDKPMRDHVLLQAIARVNRPYEDGEGRRKPAGLIVDFVGIFDKLEKALAFDSEDVQGVVEGIDVLQDRFIELMETGRQSYLGLTRDLQADKAVEAVIEHFRDEESRDAFYEFFKELEELYEILSPAPLLRPYLEDYEQMSEIYRVLREFYEPHVSADRSFLKKTEQLVQEHTRTPGIRYPESEHDLTPEAIQKLAEGDEAETVKVFNLLISLRKLVEDHGDNQPYLASIGERAEEVAKAFEERLLTSKQALQRLSETAEEYKEIRDRRRRSDLSDEAFTVQISLEKEGIDAAEYKAQQVAPVLEANPHWRRSPEQEKRVRIQLYKSLKEKTPEEMFRIVDGLLENLRGAQG